MNPPLDTHDLLLRSRGGDMDAFRQLVEHYQGYASALAIRLLRDSDEADEAVQDAFIRVWKHLPDYDPGSKFTTWLYTIVTNLCYDQLRARKRSRRVFVSAGEEVLASVPSTAREPGTIMEEKGLVREIEQLTDELPPQQRIVFVLRDLQDLEISEVAEITGLQRGAVRTNLFLARRKIRERLEMMNEDHENMSVRKETFDEMPDR